MLCEFIFVSFEVWNDPVFDFAALDLLTLVVLIDLATKAKGFCVRIQGRLHSSFTIDNSSLRDFHRPLLGNNNNNNNRSIFII